MAILKPGSLLPAPTKQPTPIQTRDQLNDALIKSGTTTAFTQNRPVDVNREYREQNIPDANITVDRTAPPYQPPPVTSSTTTTQQQTSTERPWPDRQTGLFWGWNTPTGGSQTAKYQPDPNWTNDSWPGNYRHEPNYIPSIKEVTLRAIAENGVDRNNVDAVVDILRKYGIQAWNRGNGMIDFGLGEGNIRLSDWRTMGNTANDRPDTPLPDYAPPSGSDGSSSSSSSSGGGQGSTVPITSGWWNDGSVTNDGTMPHEQTAQELAMNEWIMRLLATPTDVDEAALMASPENRAFQLAAQRAEERSRAQMAERAASTGLSASGAFETGLAGLRQQRGESESQWLGQLAITKMQQQREDIRSGIEYAMANSQFDQAQALQRQLALLDAAIQREQTAQQAATANADRSEDARQFDDTQWFRWQELLARINSDSASLGLE